MKRVIRLSDVATALVLIAVTANVTGWSQEIGKPGIVTSYLTAIDDACNPKGSILAVTPNRTCVIIKVSSKSRTLKYGKPYKFSQIKANTELDCKGMWDTTTSPPTFRTSEISIGKKLTQKQVLGQYSGGTIASRPAVRTEPQKPQLELIGCRFRNSRTLSSVSGKVKNLSDSPLKNVVAVVRYYTPQGKFVLSDTGAIDTAELKPGNTAGFRLETRWDPEFNPAVGRSKIEFHSGKGNLVVKQAD